MSTITNYKQLHQLMEESIQVLIINNKPGDYKAYVFKKVIGSDGANVDIIPVSRTFYVSLMKDRIVFPITLFKILPDKLNATVGIFPQVEAPAT